VSRPDPSGADQPDANHQASERRPQLAASQGVRLPFHFGYFDTTGAGPDGRPRAANELTLTEWDPVSKQPNYKVCAVRVTKVDDADGQPALAPTTTASAPAGADLAGRTLGEDASTTEEA
jgi:hypothetical protein